MTTKKRATRKKAAAKKAPQKTVFEKFVDSPVGMPIRVADKMFLASLGLISLMQTEVRNFRSDFDDKFEQLVKDGEKARRRYRKQFKEFRKDVAEEIDEAVEDVKEDMTEFKDKIVENVSAAAK